MLALAITRRLSRATWIAAASVVLALSWVAPALAVAPPNVPMPIVSETFTDTTPVTYEVGPVQIGGDPTVNAYWGRKSDSTFSSYSPSMYCATNVVPRTEKSQDVTNTDTVKIDEWRFTGSAAVVPGSVIVRSVPTSASPQVITYTENSDYTINYSYGQITRVKTGRIRDGAWLSISWNHVAWPTYPDSTDGDVIFDLAKTADYYSSRLAFVYQLPSRGSDDDRSFVVEWARKSSLDYMQFYNEFAITGSGWVGKSYDMSVSGSKANLSRQAGRLRFKFLDDTSRGGLRGRGPAIDNVSVTGYKYGPVRGLASTVATGTVTLKWSKPYGSIGSTAIDTRALAYRVWRTPDALPYSWSEVTSSRITTTTFTDTPTSGKTYRYFVQAWDQGAGMGYGVGDPALNNVKVAVGSTYQAPTVTRITGSNRAATSVEVSKRTFASAPAVVIANAGAWPDALPASALAGTVGGPLLMIDPVDRVAKSAPSSVMNEIKRLNATTVYICGGAGVVSDGVKSQLQAAGLTVVRKGGTDRFNTARLVSDFIKDKRGKGGTVFIAYGYSVSDALSASSIAAKMKAPVLLTKTGSVPTQTLAALNYMRPSRIIICGGYGVVSSSAQTTLKNLKWTHSVTRAYGSTRYDTSKALAVFAARSSTRGGLGLGSPKKVYLGTSANYADTLSGGVLAGLGSSGWSPVVLTAATALPTATKGYIRDTTSIHDAVLLGSTSAVSDNVKTQVLPLLH